MEITPITPASTDIVFSMVLKTDEQNSYMTTGAPIALVFTDVVGSSAAKRAAELGPDASTRDRAYLAGIQARYLRLVRGSVAEHNGKEIMTIGDAFFLTFENPIDALRCTTAVQQELNSQPIDTGRGPMQLRIGIHIGTPEFFENSWHGTDVDIAARTESAGSPGQIVVTKAAREAMGDLPEIVFRPLGTFALKGVGDVKLWDADYDHHGIRRPLLISNEQRRRNRIAVTAAVLLTTAALAATGMWEWYVQRRASILAAAAKSSIILAGFDNKTGDPVFNSTLKDGFAAQLEQSPVLKLVSQQHLQQSMRYLDKSPDGELTPADVRQIGIREGVKAYLAGSIAKLGDNYVITVSAKSISTGDDIVSEEVQAHGKDHVLDALSKLATKMRRRLGESLGSIQNLDTPLAQATTPSLEAFQAYALGDVEHEKGQDIPQAEGHYRQAVEIDPNFAMAWARLGVISLSYGQQEQALEYFTKAYTLSKNVSERERLYILSHYYQNGTGNLPRAISALDLAIHTYPLDFNNYINLGIAYGAYGQMDNYLSEFKKAAKVDPRSALAQYDIMGVQLSLDRVSDAEKTMANIKRLGLDSGSTYLLRELLLLDFLKGDREGIQRTLTKADGRVDQFQLTGSLALIQEFDGRYRDAQASWHRAGAQVAPLKAHDVDAGLILSSATGRALLGRCGDESKAVKSSLALDKSRSTLTVAVYLAALCRDNGVVSSILENLAKAYPSDTLINHVTIPQTRAALALSNHLPQDALHDLEGSQPFDLTSPGAYLRGMAYMDLHDGANAVEAFRAATQYRGAALICCQDYPLAQLGLARAYVMAGDETAAKNSYQNLFATWKTADADLPQLTAARREFARLP